jgi:hypothetical protein
MLATNTNFSPTTAEDYRNLIYAAAKLVDDICLDRFWMARLEQAAYDPDIRKTPQAIYLAARETMAAIGALNRPLPQPRRRR